MLHGLLHLCMQHTASALSNSCTSERPLLMCAGKATGSILQESDALWIEQSWNHPRAGHGSECAWSPEPGTLYVDSTINVEGKVAQYRQVYRAQV